MIQDREIWEAGGGCSPFGLTALEHVRYNIFDPYVTKIMLNCFLYMTNNLIFNNHIFNIQSARSNFFFKFQFQYVQISIRKPTETTLETENA